MEQTRKAAHQVRRARALIRVLDEWIAEKGLDSDPVALHLFAQRLPHDKWEQFATLFDPQTFKRPPSVDTVAMAVQMLKERREAEETFHRRTHGNFRNLAVIE
jgi:hypothetical protein